MSAWLSVTVGLIIGISAIAGVFWFAFARVPERRRCDEDQPHHPNAETLIQNYSSFSEHSGGDGAP